MNFDEEETNLSLPFVPSFSGRNSQPTDKSKVDHTRIEYQNIRFLIHQELGNDISDPRLDLEIYLRSNSQSEIIHHSSVYQRLEKDDPKIAESYVKAIASSAQTYKSLSDRKTPDLDKWAKKLVNSQLSKFYSQENNLSPHLSSQKTKRRGLGM